MGNVQCYILLCILNLISLFHTLVEIYIICKLADIFIKILLLDPSYCCSKDLQAYCCCCCSASTSSSSLGASSLVSRRGPRARIAMAPNGAVIKILNTAKVKID